MDAWGFEGFIVVRGFGEAESMQSRSVNLRNRPITRIGILKLIQFSFELGPVGDNGIPIAPSSPDTAPCD